MRIKFSAMTWFSILFAITCILAMAVPPTPTALHVLHIGSASYHLLVISLLVPYALIWAAGFYAYECLDRYARTLGVAKEAQAFKKIALGARVLAWGLILAAILSMVLNGIQIWRPTFVGGQTIINHYVALAVALVAFTFVGDGAHLLAKTVPAKRSLTSVRVLILLSAALGVIFARYVVRNSNIHDNPYYLSLFPLLLTIVVPYIYAWVIGFIGTYELRLYAGRVNGVLYQKGLAYLANGLVIVIFVSIIVQFITAAFTRNPQVSLGYILLIVFTLIIMEAAGFVLVALGAKKLQKIEEV